MLFHYEMLQLFASFHFASLISALEEENIKLTSLKTVVKWGKSLECELEKTIESGKVVKIKCKDCIQFESRIKNIKELKKSWIDGTGSVKKDSLEKHLSGEPHKYAKNLSRKKSLGSVNIMKKSLKHQLLERELRK